MEQGQRLYIVFSREQALRFLSHLDMMRLWKRALRRAQLPLRYSQGYHPHPRLSLALPLAVGMTAEAEWLEVELLVPVSPATIQAQLATQLPAGLTLLRVEDAPWKAPSLTSCLQGVEYEVEIQNPLPREEIQCKVNRFLRAEHWIVEEQRQGRVRSTDLRQLVARVEVYPWRGKKGRLWMHLHYGTGPSARLGTILAAFGVGPEVLLHRKRLIFRDDFAAAQKGE